MSTLYRVTYHRDENSPAVKSLTKFFASSFDPGSEICSDRWPNLEMNYARWEPVAEVGPAHRVGSFYGMTLHESGWDQGEREARLLGLK
jgi:hypothetical protein